MVFELLLGVELHGNGESDRFTDVGRVNEVAVSLCQKFNSIQRYR